MDSDSTARGGRAQIIGPELWEPLIEEALRSPRRRVNFNFHQSYDDNPQRFLNVLTRGTYVAPHRHLSPAKPESFVVMGGRVAMFIFDEQGALQQAIALGPTELDPMAPSGIDLPPGVWHTIGPISAAAVLFEVKPGPYRPEEDKEFAPWAPAEGDPEAQDYLSGLMVELFRQGD